MSGGSRDTDDRLLAVMPCGPSVGIARGDDGDASGESPEQLAEVGLVNGVLGHRTIRARKRGLSTARAGSTAPVTPTRVSAMPRRRPMRATAWSKRPGTIIE